jgi:glucosamine-6-phosphate deaminase
VKIEILATAADVAAKGAGLFIDAVKANPSIVMALPTGRTPISMYERLAAERSRGADFSSVTSFNLDEVLLPKAMPQTFFQFMTKHVWGPLEIDPAKRFIPDGDCPDPEAECSRYESAILRAGGLDLAFLGIGADGHIAYNLPGQVRERTHVVTLDPATIATLGGEVPSIVRAITMGTETILGARRIVLLATGASKAGALKRMHDDPKSDVWPCTLFRDHKDLLILADADAASQL